MPTMHAKNLIDGHERKLQRVPAAGLLVFIAMIILGYFTKTTQHIHFILLIGYWYLKLIRAVSTSDPSSSLKASLFFDHWLVLNCLIMYLLNDSSVQLAS